MRVDANVTMLPGSPTNSFLADEVASTCPLLTPSPPTNDLINPLPEPVQPCFAIGEELANKLQHVKGEKGTGLWVFLKTSKMWKLFISTFTKVFFFLL